MNYQIIKKIKNYLKKFSKKVVILKFISYNNIQTYYLDIREELKWVQL